MKYIKIAIAAIVIVGALFFIYMTVVRHGEKPAAVDEEAMVRARLERDIQTMPSEVDPATRKRLEDFFAKTASTTEEKQD